MIKIIEDHLQRSRVEKHCFSHGAGTSEGGATLGWGLSRQLSLIRSPDFCDVSPLLGRRPLGIWAWLGQACAT